MWLLMLLLYSSVVYSQVLNVSGSVSTNGIPVKYASLIFIDQSDTSKKFSTITDTLGNYNVNVLTAIEDNKFVLPVDVELAQNYPNPFSSSTVISYELNKQSNVSIKIYDILGREIKTFWACAQAIGTNEIIWDGKDNDGKKVTPGIYFYQLKTRNETHAKKMIYGLGGISVNSTISNTLFPSSRRLEKETKASINQGTYTVQIKSIDSTKPLIVVQEIPDITINRDTTLNFTVEEARIILGQSIDGVKAGDDSLTVIEKMGKPNSIYDADLNGYIFAYISDGNPHARLYIVLLIDPIFTSSRTAVIFIEADYPYKGKTKEGVGIGMSRSDVLKLLGNPTSTDPGGPPIVDNYFIDPLPGDYRVNFIITYDATEKIIRIQMGM